MILYPDALKLVISNVPKPQVAAMPIEKTIGHILARDITSQVAMPLFNKSAMDGYALKACDTNNTHRRLKCKGEVKAGEVFRGMIKKGECLKIMTGAPVPPGAEGRAAGRQSLRGKRSRRRTRPLARHAGPRHAGPARP